jgi:signal transduction histidine kinase/CheY-like chemotaxis protein
MSRDVRIDRLLSLVLELANGNLEARLEPSSRSEPLDGVIEGLNMLAEELSASTAALKRSEESFRSLIERSPDAIIVHRDDKFVYVNAAALTLLGHRHSSELAASSLLPLLSSGPGARDEGELIHRNGTTVYVEVASISVIFDGQAATLSIARDISARKELTAKMMEMDRMIAVGTLAAGVGHEINNPLAYIIGNLDFALDVLRTVEGRPSAREKGAEGSERMGRTLLPGAAQQSLLQALAEAREGSERVRQIVRDLRTFSSMQPASVSSFELRPVLDSAIHMTFNEIRHRAQLVRDYGRVPLMAGCPSRLGQVFLNLLVNAAHAIPVGAANEHRITVRTSYDAGHVRIEVSDTGIGIEPEHLARLFDPFFTTKPVGQGTGLGLFICKRIVHEHDGELEVESKPGLGSTFRVLLPVRESAYPREMRREMARPAALKRARVLVVDDEPGIARSLARALARDHDVATATSAHEALKQLLESDRYDVVLCDLMMPDMTGVDLYAELERRRPELAQRVLFFTGGAFTPATQAFVQRMGERCLEKPFDVGEVRRKLAALCPS